MVFQEGGPLVLPFVEDFVADFIEREGHLLVFGVGEIVLTVEVTLLFVGYDLLHQFHGRIILAAVTSALYRHGDACECLVVGNEPDGDVLVLAKVFQLDGLWLIPHGRDAQFFPGTVFPDDKTPVFVCLFAHIHAVIEDIDKVECLVCLAVDNTSCHLRLRRKAQHEP